MKQNPTVILPLATALASLAGGATHATTATVIEPTDAAKADTNTVQPNTIFKAGDDLLGLLVTAATNGTVVAQHASH